MDIEFGGLREKALQSALLGVLGIEVDDLWLDPMTAEPGGEVDGDFGFPDTTLAPFCEDDANRFLLFFRHGFRVV